jgi:hypothetical protein
MSNKRQHYAVGPTNPHDSVLPVAQGCCIHDHTLEELGKTGDNPCEAILIYKQCAPLAEFCWVQIPINSQPLDCKRLVPYQWYVNCIV